MSSLTEDLPAGRVLGIAVRTAPGGPMLEIREALASVDGGIAGDVASSLDRGVSFIADAHWRQVIAELDANLPWHTRRANVLVDAPTLAPWIGRVVRLGGVEVRIAAETKPCGVMDAQFPGLREALKPECRGGVHGRVIRTGAFRVGDVIRYAGPA